LQRSLHLYTDQLHQIHIRGAAVCTVVIVDLQCNTGHGILCGSGYDNGDAAVFIRSIFAQPDLMPFARAACAFVYGIGVPVAPCHIDLAACLTLKGKGKGAVVLAIALAIGIFAGSLIGSYIVNIGNKQPKTFSCNEVSITLTKEFRDFDYSDGVYDFVYETKKVCVFGLKEKFSEFPEVKDFTVEEYGNFLIIINELKDTELEEENGITFFEYDAYNSEVDSYYHYYVCLYPRDDAFWVVQFATLSKDFEKYRSDIAEWARSVDFSS